MSEKTPHIPHILVVDDEEGLRMTIAANLELEDFEVTEAGSAEEALLLVQENDYDLVLSDVRMPGISGVEMFLKLKETRPDLPVVLMTAFTSEDTMLEAIRGGVFTVLAKPFDIEQTTRTLRDALRRPVVLVVDDSESVATSTANALDSIGLRTQAAFSGEAALAAMATAEVDVCVVDLVMPDMDGLELARRLREINKEIVVVVFSGHARADEMMRVAAAEGAYRCLRKPVEPVELAQSIASARGRGR